MILFLRLIISSIVLCNVLFHIAIAEDLSVVKRKEILVLDRLIQRSDKKKFPTQLYYRRATAFFDLAIGESNVNSPKYKSYLLGAQKDLKLIEKNDPKFQEISQTYMMNAQIYERMGKFNEAIEGYQKYLSETKDSKDRSRALLRMSFLFSEKKDFSKMLETLKQVKLNTQDDSYYLWKKQLIFASRNLNDLEAALFYIKESFKHVLSAHFSTQERPREIDYLVTQISEVFLTLQLSSGSLATHEKALNTIEDISKDPKVFSSMVLRYSYLLRAQGKANVFISWVKLVLSRGNSQELVYTLYSDLIDYLAQYIHSKPEQEEYVATIDQFTAIALNEKANVKINSQIRDKLTQAQHFMIQRLKKEKDAGYQNNYRFVLSKIYENLAKFTDEINDKKLLSIYNMSENQYGLKNYLKAFQGYLQVKVQGNGVGASKSIVQSSHIKAIASYYEYLKISNSVFATKITPQVISGDQTLPSDLNNWLALVDEYYKLYPHDEKILSYYYESARIVYHYKNYTEAFVRFNGVIRGAHFSEEYKFASVSIILDTLQKSLKWSEVYTFANQLVDHHKEYKVSSQLSHFQSVGAQAFLKKAEELYENKQYEALILDSNNFLKSYSTTKYHESISKIAGNAALKLNKRELAVQFFQFALKKGDQSDGLKTKIVGLKASENEKNFEIEEALSQYMVFINALTPEEISNVKDLKGYEYILDRALLSAWLTRSKPELGTLLTHPLCKKFSNKCANYHFNFDILVFSESPSSVSKDHIIMGMRSGDKVRKNLYSFMSLFQSDSKHTLLQKKAILMDLAKTKKDIPIDIYINLALEVEKYSDGFFMDYQQDLYKNSPLVLQAQSIQKRSAALAELEKTFQLLQAVFSEEQRVKFLYYIATEYRKTTLELSQSIPSHLSDEEKEKLSKTVDSLVAPLKERESANIRNALNLTVASGVGIEYERIKHHSLLLEGVHDGKKPESFLSYPVASLNPRHLFEKIKFRVQGEQVLFWQKALLKSYEAEQWPGYLSLVQTGVDRQFIEMKDREYFLGLMSYKRNQYAEAYYYFKNFIRLFEKNKIINIDIHALTAFIFENALKVNDSSTLKNFAGNYSKLLTSESVQKLETTEENSALILIGFYEAKTFLSGDFSKKLNEIIENSEIKKMVTTIERKRNPAQTEKNEE